MADSILRLRVEDKEYNASLKQARQGLLALQQALQQSGATFQHVDKATVEYARGLGRMETTAKTAKGRIGEMTSAFTELRMQYKQMTDAEKNSPFGKAMNQSLNELKGRIQETKKQMSDVDNELKAAKVDTTDFSGVIGELGSKLGVSSELMGVLTTGTMGYTAAIGASVSAVIAATKAWVEYNDELNKQRNITAVTTGLSGTEADDLTIGVRALATTYDVDFREAINAANTLIQQFGVNGYEALSLLQDGMQGMIAGDGGKLLSMIQQYAPAFRDAGVSASQLVAVIQNSEGGLFTDQNMNAIVMGIKNIRLMTDNTSEALAKLGIDGEEMSRKLEDGSMNIFEALQQVAGKIDDVGSGSKAAGEVMQYVFGRQGAMAGTKLGEAIASLNTNLEETKTQTGELGQSFAKLNEANVRLEATMQEIFGMTGWEDMNNLLKTEFANTLTFTLETFVRAKNALDDIYSAIESIGNNNAFARWAIKINEVIGPLGSVYGLLRNIIGLQGGSTGGGSLGSFMQRASGIISESRNQGSGSGGSYTVVRRGGKVVSATHTGADGSVIDYTGRYTTPTTTGGRGGRGGRGGGGGGTTTPEKELTIQQQIAKLEKEALTATDERRAEIAKTVQELDKVLEKQKKITEELHKGKEVKTEYEGKGVFTGMPESTDFADSDTRSPSERMRDSVLAAMSDKAMAVDEETMRTLMQTSIENGIDGIDWDSINEMMWEGMDVPNDVWEKLQEQFNEKLKSLGKDPLDIDFSTGKKKKDEKKEDNKLKDITQGVSQAVGSLSTVAGTLQQLGIDIPKGFQSMLGVLQTITSILTAIQALQQVGTALGLFSNGGLVGRAAGGMLIPGNSFSGDNLRMPAVGGGVIGVNSGELILNRVQQGVLANALQGNSFDNLELTASLNGEDIVFAIDNASRRRGKGTMVRLRR